MTASADRPVRAALLAALLLGAAPAALAQPIPLTPQAQGNAPTPLGPQPPAGTPAGEPLPAPGGVEAVPLDDPLRDRLVRPDQPRLGPSGVEVQELKALDPQMAGPLDASNGGMPADLWAGTPRAQVERLLAEMPAPLPSAALRAVARKVLLTAADAPEGEPGPRNLAGLRLEKLAQLGEPKDADALAQTAPPALEDEQGALAWMALELLAGGETACAQANVLLARFKHPAWQKYQVACQVQAGQVDAATLGIDLLREQGDKDDTFFRLAEAAAAGQKAPIRGVTEPTPPQLALAIASGRALPADVKVLSPAHALGLVRSASPMAVRLAAAEQAALWGAIDKDGLLRLYEQVEAADAKALLAPGRKGNPLYRAQLVRALRAEPSAAAKAGLLKAAVQASGPGLLSGPYGALLAAEVGVMQPTPGFAVVAPHIARLLLLQGEADRSRPWVALSRDDFRAGKDAGAYARLWPLAAAQGLVREGEVDMGPWVRDLGKDPAAARDLADNVLLVLSAATNPSGRAVTATGKGEAALRALSLLSEAGLQDPTTLADALSLLNAAGLSAEGRQVAVEALAGMLGS